MCFLVDVLLSFYLHLRHITDEGLPLQMRQLALILSKHTYTKTPAGLLDHDGPTAEGLSCDCTYQSDS